MSIKAKSKNTGISVKKLKPIVNLVRGMNAAEAITTLSFRRTFSIFGVFLIIITFEFEAAGRLSSTALLECPLFNLFGSGLINRGSV